MSKRNWTPEQEQAIFAKWINDEKTKRGNILVNAAAGSGKTAVLVERIIKKLMPDDGSEPTSIDKLLVVTFTNAAAAEMQERIAAALGDCLTKAIAEHDYKKQKFLKRQISLLPFSDITTIDAFCLKAVRNHFHLLNIDPDFTIMDSGELELLKADAMEELFEKLYEEKNEGFFELLSSYTDGRDDAAVADKIKQIYNFTRAFPDPEGWLYKKAEKFSERNLDFWLSSAAEQSDIYIRKALEKLTEAMEVMIGQIEDEFDGIEDAMEQMPPLEENPLYLAWGTYYTAVHAEYLRMKKALVADWDEKIAILSEPYITLNQKALFVDKEYQVTDKDKKEQVKELRTQAKDYALLAKQEMGMERERISGVLTNKLYPIAKALVEITNRFDEIYSEMKLKKNTVEFSDLEHSALRLFSEFPDVQNEYKNKYEEILMDEYQDTNRLQEEIFKKISTGDNIFMVGDMKQSIYRFRSSDPSIFKEKSDSYKKDEHAENRKIVLSKNFRSRKEVLDSINDIFGLIMTEKAGGIDYDEDQRLNVGDESYEPRNADYRSEFMVIEEKWSSSELIIDKVTLEARAIAGRILKLREEGFLVRDRELVQVRDPETGSVKKEMQTVYRELKNKDITILMSSYKGVADIYVDELSKAGISCYAKNDGYFERNEVKLVMALLKIIENPYQDIPLLGVLRSPIGGFSDDDLVNIRLSKEGYIFSAMRELVKKLNSGELEDEETVKSAEKTKEFIVKLTRWRDYSRYMPSDKLLWTLYEETEIYGFVGALYGREEAQANLRLLFERAKKYENSGYKGLFNFVRYVGLLKKKSEDLATAQMVTENHDVVRIMTIHASKGLEFPVVFVAGAGKGFNMRDTSGSMILHKDWGFGLDYVDYERGIKLPTVSKNVVSAAISRESIAEEIRKLYVALTRAKEKLIVTATVSGRNKKDEGGIGAKMDAWRERTEMSDSDILACRCFADWIGPASLHNPHNWVVTAIEYGKELSKEFPEDTEAVEEEIRSIDLDKLLEYRYPYENSADIPSKVSVTELKGKKGVTALVPLPDFMKPDTEVKGAARGTVIHYIMQTIPFADVMDKEYVDGFIRSLVDAGELTEAEAGAVDSDIIAGFYESELGKRMINSKKVFREQLFETAISAKMVDAEFPEDEEVILQGIIDCYFEEDDGIVLVDYKSDYYKDISEMKEKYTIQLELYADSIEKITKKKVKDKYLYLFFTNTVLEL